jgi:hypothetical protein
MPRMNDKLFPDLNVREFIERTARRMEEFGFDPAHIHAFRKTGMFAHSGNWHLYTKEMRDEWDAAVEEYRKSKSPDC